MNAQIHTERGTGCAFYVHDEMECVIKLNKETSIPTAKAIGILKAIEYIDEQKIEKSIILNYFGNISRGAKYKELFKLHLNEVIRQLAMYQKIIGVISDSPAAVQNNAHGNNLQNDLKAQRADIALLESTEIQNAQISALLQKKEAAIPKEFPFTFPKKSVGDIQALRKRVDVLISYLATIGGRYLSCKVSRMLKRVFDKLVAKYNSYRKRSDRRPFSEICLKTVVLSK
ncbi:hypothetical protein JTB14_027839 [Gonioctena quinquepunctata]|nr:hypothetical protein JTB14_027839 [Gonioctena quinquepunctata]